MNLHQLEYILALDKCRHFGRAAESCNVAQPSLSTMIQKLEDELGVKIFDRSKQPIEPTVTGRRILEQARVILHQAGLMQEIIMDEESSLSGRLKLGILPTIAPYLIPRLIPLLDEELSELSVDFVEMTTSDCLHNLGIHKLDMAIIASEPNTESLESSVLFYEEFYGFVGREHPLFKEESIRSSQVSSENLWLLDEGHCFRDQLLRFCELRRSAPNRYSYKKGSLETFMNMVRLGKGMTFIPALALDLMTEKSRELVRPFTIPRPTREIHLVYRSDFMRRKLMQKLCELIQRAVPEEMHSLTSEQCLS